MISNQILQTTVDGLKAISRVDLCVIDSDGKIAAKTFDDVQGCVADALTFMDSPAESQVVNGYQFFKVIDEQNLEYILLDHLSVVAYALSGGDKLVLSSGLWGRLCIRGERVYDTDNLIAFDPGYLAGHTGESRRNGIETNLALFLPDPHSRYCRYL